MCCLLLHRHSLSLPLLIGVWARRRRRRQRLGRGRRGAFHHPAFLPIAAQQRARPAPPLLGRPALLLCVLWYGEWMGCCVRACSIVRASDQDTHAEAAAGSQKKCRSAEVQKTTSRGGGSTTRFSDGAGAIRNLKSEGGKSNPPIREQRHAAASVVCVTSESPAVHNVPAAGCLPANRVVPVPSRRVQIMSREAAPVDRPTATDESRAAVVGCRRSRGARRVLCCPIRGRLACDSRN